MLVALAFAGLVVLAAAPVAVWHRVLFDVIHSFHWSLAYVVGELTPWLLFVVAIGFLIPVAVSAGSDPESRLYPRGRRAYVVWGTVMYLLGLILAAQVGEVWSYAH